ncbi:endonuclease/exonuclease/phosphatase family protein [Shewanella surugensis]|uniref:Endonuclease/exonuclease/phosphatase family protein n=1 Tax=Shewanella surugensis TaxID=212020 RepID=A0ABT0L710_9GAMM|nr:endonuclease/exonuclease/phosphatase family protein [Shewanella surugensis]MCL1123463.1 endonuclease/exonuclease/phosphatase family protein [Shewanella surugensis]
MTKRKKIILISIFGFFLVSYTDLSYVFSLNNMPKVLSNEVISTIKQPCVYKQTGGNIDKKGQLSLAIWNIYKQQKPNWLPQLSELVEKNNLVLLQEAKLSSSLLNYLSSSSSVYFMAEAFRIGRSSVGVMTISDTMSLRTCALLSAEPWIRFPKSTLISVYALSNGQNLLVVNLHGINFDWRLIHYKEQFKALADFFMDHEGPAILAGDFNTWRLERQAVVDQFAHSWGLTEARFTVDQRISAFNYPLDHLYYRELELISANAFETQASDHSPIIATFKLIDEP